MRAKLTVATAMGVGLALSLSACGGSSGGGGKSSSATGSSKSSGGGSTAGAGLPSSAYTKAAYSSVKQGGTLTGEVSQLPTNYNNYQANGLLGDTQTIQNPITPAGGGFNFNADGTYKINPDYLTSAKVVASSPTKIEVKMNPKGVWSDGKPITYMDEVNNWKALNGTNAKFEAATTSGWDQIASVTKGATNYDYTVTFKTAYSDWVGYIYPVLPSVASDTPTHFNTTYASKQYPTNGPFVISKIDASAQVITETPNPRWWGRKPKLDKIVWRVIDQSSIGQSFVNKELDVVDTQANADVIKQASGRSDSTLEKSGGLSWTQLTTNDSKPPFNDVNVRKAVAFGIDRTTFAKVVQKGLTVPPQTQGNGILMPGQKGYEDNFGAAYPYSTSKAEALLKQSGYTKGSDGYFAKNGQTLSFAILVPSGTPTNAQRAQLIQTFLQKIGIKVTLNTVPTAKYFSDYIQTGNYQASSFTWQGGLLPVSSSEPIYYPANGGSNYSKITGPNQGKLWAKALSDLNPTSRLADIDAIDKDLTSYVAIIPLATTPLIWGVKKGVVNYGPTQFETIDWTQVGYSS
ncbi:ABC transporter family substrate-binding protein [Allobranchiibius sp. GilTou73]|uniref:ABC transporter family substrate-binding protein n=1 Tax=Allobranchiibius sp. GilTou73 TaxID=2904523 RepID=UPI001F2B21EA|nr:ABC transporter family substrate-binding protein [Allobranchiibius sp. GilTou73]UIJ34166.1 ABC transporter family substrate-binding protein [Allobranchiibius sp. GilTou73]